MNKCTNCKKQDSSVVYWINAWGYSCNDCIKIIKDKIKKLTEGLK